MSFLYVGVPNRSLPVMLFCNGHLVIFIVQVIILGGVYVSGACSVEVGFIILHKQLILPLLAFFRVETGKSEL